MRGRLGLLFLMGLTGCTTVNVAALPSVRDTREVFVTTSDVPGPYQSLGLVQTTRKGVLLFGFADPAATDLEGGLRESLIPEVRRMGGDGIMNVRFHQTQYGLPTRILFALLFFIPLPSQVTLSGEVVRLGAGTPPPPFEAPSR
ncbi:hypothetical protein [Melittangium boletus]|uniref:Lipoprotein n=1 Tax=Melittangium boletus DSM 14713 TaxID=1294270 RepID=A0A250I995_9BACT|nr:hypothetical protein [Melittangium boletus]ATB27707.1 hypothetical protein MEBOL_001152 [Melittangium boletus DSM 14713]